MPACALQGWQVVATIWPSDTAKHGHPRLTKPVSSCRNVLSKSTPNTPLLPPDAQSVPFYLLSPWHSLAARRDLVFVFLSVCSCFYCTIFCHFGLRKGVHNAISPLLRPPLWERVAWPVCWAGKRGREGVKVSSNTLLIRPNWKPDGNFTPLSFSQSCLLHLPPLSLFSPPPLPSCTPPLCLFSFPACILPGAQSFPLFGYLFPFTPICFLSPCWMFLSTVDHFLSLTIHFCARRCPVSTF